MRIRNALALLWLLSLAAGTALAADSFVWWEGERPVETNFPGGNPFGLTREHPNLTSLLTGR